MVVGALGWPRLILRVLILAVIFASPIVALLAWYHGDKARSRVSGPELVMITVLLLIAGSLLWMFSSRSEPGSSPIAQAPQERARAASDLPEASIAVLPFADLSPEKDQEYFVDGLSEEILNSLARVEGLRVAGRTSSFYYKGRNEDLRTIGETLGVAHLLEGSVRKYGDRLRITAQLIKAADGFHVWSQTYDRPMQDIFAIQEDIARAVAGAMQIALGVGELGQLPGMTRDVEAYEAWLEARAAAAQLTIDGYTRAAERLELAVQRDPAFVVGWIELVSAYRNLALRVPGDPARVQDYVRRSLTAAAEGARHNPDAPLARVLSRLHLVDRGDWVNGEEVLQTVDSFTAAHRALISIWPVDIRSIWLISVDKASQVIERLEQRRLRDPLDAGIATYLAEAYGNAGRIADAIAEQERGFELVPNEMLAANALMTAGAARDPVSIEKSWEKVHAVVQDPRDPVQMLHPLRDRPAEARAELRRIAAREPRTIPASRLALWAAFFGDPELALQALREERDIDRRLISAIALWRPIMRDVRRLPALKDLVREWGFVDYWRKYGWGDHCRPVSDTDFECT